MKWIGNSWHGMIIARGILTESIEWTERERERNWKFFLSPIIIFSYWIPFNEWSFSIGMMVSFDNYYILTLSVDYVWNFVFHDLILMTCLFFVPWLVYDRYVLYDGFRLCTLWSNNEQSRIIVNVSNVSSFRSLNSLLFYSTDYFSSITAAVIRLKDDCIYKKCTWILVSKVLRKIIVNSNHGKYYFF